MGGSRETTGLGELEGRATADIGDKLFEEKFENTYATPASVSSRARDSLESDIATAAMRNDEPDIAGSIIPIAGTNNYVNVSYSNYDSGRENSYVMTKSDAEKVRNFAERYGIYSFFEKGYEVGTLVFTNADNMKEVNR